jgi:hypothetical protein
MGSKSKVLMLDCDGVIFNFCAGVHNLAKELFNKELVTHHRCARTWEAWSEPLTKAETNIVWTHVKTSKTFWFTLPPIINVDDFAMLNTFNDVYYVTAREGDTARLQTASALYACGIDSPSVILSRKKGEVARALDATHAIDDKLGNAVAISWLSPKTHSYILDYPYNRVDPDIIGGNVLRMYTVAEFLHDVARRSAI